MHPRQLIASFAALVLSTVLSGCGAVFLNQGSAYYSMNEGLENPAAGRASKAPQFGDAVCVFVDDSLSAFKFNDLIACGTDSLVEWRDVNPEAARPYAGKVWAGYDPQESEDGDNAALVIAAAPTREGGPFRLLERHQLRGLDFEQQASFIRAALSRYDCTYLGIDATGVGAAVYQLLVKPEYGLRGVTKIEYSLEVKAQMVMKAQHTVARGRLELDAGWLDLVSAFVSIKKTLTTSGRAVTFRAGRGGNDGHADLAWATMHILMNEPLDGKAKPVATMEII